MSIENYNIKKKTIERPWGTEVRFNAVHKETGKIFDDVIICAEKDGDDRIDKWLQKQEAISEKEKEEITYTKKEIEDLLIEKGYLNEGQSLDELKENDKKVI